MDQLNEFIRALNRWNVAVGGALAVSGWVFTAIALVLAIVSIRGGRQPRRFGWQTRSVTSVWNPELLELPHKIPLKLVLGTTPIEGQPWVTILRIGNTGRLTVEFDEKRTPLHLEYKRSTLIDAMIVDRSSSEIDAELLRPSSKSLTLRPSSLQRREWLELLLITDGKEYPRITAKVKDETAPACNVQRLQFKVWWSVLLSLLALFFLLGSYTASYQQSGASQTAPGEPLLGLTGLLSLVVFVYGVRRVLTKFRWARKRS